MYRFANNKTRRFWICGYVFLAWTDLPPASFKKRRRCDINEDQSESESNIKALVPSRDGKRMKGETRIVDAPE